MSDKQKGISLRRKRGDKLKKGPPIISAPRQISSPMPVAPGIGSTTLSNSSQPSNESIRSKQGKGEGVWERPQRADKTADLVKRRYSQRITALPTDFSNGLPLPDLPSLPSQYKEQSQVSDGKRSRSPDGRGLKLDMKALRDPNLRAEQCEEYSRELQFGVTDNMLDVSSVLADASEEDIRRFQDDLRKTKQRTSVDLQTNVYQNRTQFIKISKEAEKLKGEMRTLRQLMSDLTTTLEQTASATGASGASSNKRANRSSIGDLNQIRAGQLQQLYRDVEGSQKFLPPIPGRFILWKSKRWFELDSATLKARRRVRMLLLNDHLLIAAEKKARNDVSGQREGNRVAIEFVAQKCFPLLDVHLTRTKNERIIIRTGSNILTYDTKNEDRGDKAIFVSTFRKAKDDLQKDQEANIQEKDRTQDAYSHLISRDGALLQKTELLENLSEGVNNDQVSSFIDIDGQQRNIRWVEGQLDDLDIEIALQRFEEAVDKVDRLKALAKNIKGNEVAKAIVTFKVNERTAKLANVLIKNMVDHNNWFSSVKEHVNWVVQLGFEDKARESYLVARGNLIKLRSRQCIFEGDLPSYIFQISYIYFTVIKNTVDMFQKCFPQQLMSACVKWAKEHIDQFNLLLRRQLSSVEESGSVWQECLDVVREHAESLKEVGIDFSELLWTGVNDGIEEDVKVQPVGLGVTV